MGPNTSIITLLKDTFQQAINELSENYQGSSLTDIFIVLDRETGEISFYDDEENSVAKIVVFDWVDNKNLSDEEVIEHLREVTVRLNDEDKFTALDLYKPFSINYADDSMQVIEELLLIDDESTIKIDNDLLNKLDKEFDEFIEKLLKE